MADWTVVLDLDGVVRHFDPDQFRAVERDHGLPDGSVAAVAFEAELLDRLVTGRLRRAEWIEIVGERLGNAAAARACFAPLGRIDQAVLEFVDELRRRGTTVAILTNGTDTIEAELRESGVGDRFDAVFSTWDIGVAKPDPRAFEHVCAALGVPATSCVFVDDTESKLTGATALGMTTHHFQGPAGLRDLLVSLELLV